jgi:chemotaxis regulatin CheY-phosphate phosphatase CheZ
MTQNTPETPESGSVGSVICALQKVIALLDRIKNTIEESSGKIPKASVQLSTVTQATEMATVEILNVLDTMAQKIMSAEQRLGSVRQCITSSEGQVTVDDIGQSLNDVKEDALNITMALQIQDITAQKIAGVNHLIESVRMELLHELNYFESASSEEASSEPAATSFRADSQGPQAFDKNASFRKAAEHQEHIDRVVLEWREKQSADRQA